MVRFSPFVALLLLGATCAETLSGPSKFEEQGDRGLAVEGQDARELAYADWGDARGPRYWREDPIYGQRAGNGRYYGNG